MQKEADMKKDKGKQVFSGNIDDILADKIIEHTEANSADASTEKQEEIAKPNCCFDDSSCGTLKRIITWSLALFALVFFISLVLKKVKANVNQ